MTVTTYSIKFWACGFDDVFPCARNRYTFGLGAVLFTNESHAQEYVASKVITCREFTAKDKATLDAIIERQRSLTANHMRSLGYSDEQIAREVELFDQRMSM